MVSFWAATGPALSKRLFAAGGSGLVFWVWAGVAWSMHQGGWGYLQSTMAPLLSDRALVRLLAVVITAVVVVSVSALLVERLTMPVLRALEGYWPRLAQKLRDRRVEHWQRELEQLKKPPDGESPSPNVGVKLRQFPIRHEEVMPTRIGNIIRAGETRPWHWYGLDTVIVWPQLWLVLPERVRGDVTAARRQLDTAVSSLIWATASCALAVLWWPALVVGLVVAAAIWWWRCPAAATVYATVISAVIDTHRFDLYDALHHPRPVGPGTEPEHGRALTASLWFDPTAAPSSYTTTKKPPSRSAPDPEQT